MQNTPRGCRTPSIWSKETNRLYHQHRQTRRSECRKELYAPQSWVIRNYSPHSRCGKKHPTRETIHNLRRINYVVQVDLLHHSMHTGIHLTGRSLQEDHSSLVDTAAIQGRIIQNYTACSAFKANTWVSRKSVFPLQADLTATRHHRKARNIQIYYPFNWIRCFEPLSIKAYALPTKWYFSGRQIINWIPSGKPPSGSVFPNKHNQSREMHGKHY